MTPTQKYVIRYNVQPVSYILHQQSTYLRSILMLRLDYLFSLCLVDWRCHNIQAMAACQATSSTSGQAHRPLRGSTQSITYRNCTAGNVLKSERTSLRETMIMINNLENKMPKKISGLIRRWMGEIKENFHNFFQMSGRHNQEIWHEKIT
jgi:hypothetical protein